MSSLDFLNSPSWKVKRCSPRRDSIRGIEEDYWWIDEDEAIEEQVSLEAFYDHCLNTFVSIAQENNFSGDCLGDCSAITPIGEKVVFEYLYDRYLVQRHESNPDIFYSYVVQLSFEAGITIAKKWKDSSADLETYIDKIIQETSMDDISDICQQYLNIDSQINWLDFMSKLANPAYDLLKWYHQEDNFEEYKLKLLLAVFQVGAAVMSEKCGC